MADTEVDYRSLDLDRLYEHERQLKKAIAYKKSLARKQALTQIKKLMTNTGIEAAEITGIGT